MMKQIFLPNHPEIGVKIRLSSRARRLSLRISSLDGQVMLSGPPHVQERDFFAFLLSKEAWIVANLATLPTPCAVTVGAEVYFGGQRMRIIRGAHRGVIINDTTVSVGQSIKSVGAGVKGYFKAAARNALAQASDRYADTLGVSYANLVLRDTRSRWGSCSSQRQLMYSWRLIMAPPAILEYVAAHEVSHLVEMNHSPAFWDVVESIYPNYKSARQWLRSNGSSLHRYDFDA
jgi:predicted metal-dependent hydrolase